MRVRSVLAVGAVLALLLSGCSRGQEANDSLPTASSSASAEATLEPLGPPDLPMPAEAREQTPAGAEAFIRYYVNIINLAQSNLDTTYVRDFSSDCSSCDQLASGLESFASQGFTYDGGTITVDGLSLPPTADAQVDFAVVLTQAGVRVVDSGGAEVGGFSQATSQFSGSGGSLSWDSDSMSWLITELTIG